MKSRLKPSIKVFVTKTRKFRAQIIEITGEKYEVTVGGEEWVKGKGRAHELKIYNACVKIIGNLQQQHSNIIGTMK